MIPASSRRFLHQLYRCEMNRTLPTPLFDQNERGIDAAFRFLKFLFLFQTFEMQ